MSDFYYPQYPDELYHHGVLGMKWGVRRYQNKDGSLTNAGRKRQKSDTSEAHPDYTRAHSSKSVKSMSDSELQKVNNRLNMERNYKSLTTKEVSTGKKFVQKAIIGAAIGGATVAVSSRVSKATGQAVGKTLDKAIALGKEVVKYGVKNGFYFGHSALSDSDELYHHGVKGMKWGKHLTSAQLTEATNDVINGKYGNGDERKKNLGSHYDQIQEAVNKKLSAKDDTKISKSVKDGEKLAQQVINGKYGNGQKRVKALGDKYAYVQNLVNEKLYGKSTAKSIAKRYGWNFSESKKSSSSKSSNKSTSKTSKKSNSSKSSTKTSKKTSKK